MTPRFDIAFLSSLCMSLIRVVTKQLRRSSRLGITTLSMSTVVDTIATTREAVSTVVGSGAITHLLKLKCPLGRLDFSLGLLEWIDACSGYLNMHLCSR